MNSDAKAGHYLYRALMVTHTEKLALAGMQKENGQILWWSCKQRDTY